MPTESTAVPSVAPSVAPPSNSPSVAPTDVTTTPAPSVPPCSGCLFTSTGPCINKFNFCISFLPDSDPLKCPLGFVDCRFTSAPTIPVATGAPTTVAPTARPTTDQPTTSPTGTPTTRSPTISIPTHVPTKTRTSGL